MYGNQPPWGYGPQPPPYYGSQPVQFIPVPQGTDVEKTLKLLERIQRKQLKKDEKLKKEEEEKKKKHHQKHHETPKVPLPMVFLLMLTFGLPVGALELWVLQMVGQTVKNLLP